MMPLPARAIKSSGGSTVGDRNRVPTPERSDLGGVFKGMPDTPTGGVVHARDLRKRGIRPWAHGHQRCCACFPRSAVKIGNPRYYELRKPGGSCARQAAAASPGVRRITGLRARPVKRDPSSETSDGRRRSRASTIRPGHPGPVSAVAM